jgi:type IV pilus assembly protein PilM
VVVCVYVFSRSIQKLAGDQLLKKHEDSVLGVDIGQSSIKIVQLRNEQGVAMLETYGEIALGPYGDSVVGQAVRLSPDTIAKALKELMQGAGVTATTGGVSVSFAASLVKLIEVPALDPKQLATVIPIEARKYIPVPITEVQLDWFIVS